MSTIPIRIGLPAGTVDIEFSPARFEISLAFPSGGGPPTGAAGGALGGTFPSPTLSTAKQTELDAKALASSVATAVLALQDVDATKAALSSPVFVGDPRVPAGDPVGDNSITRKKWVLDQLALIEGGGPSASPIIVLSGPNLKNTDGSDVGFGQIFGTPWWSWYLGPSNGNALAGQAGAERMQLWTGVELWLQYGNAGGGAEECKFTGFHSIWNPGASTPVTTFAAPVFDTPAAGTNIDGGLVLLDGDIAVPADNGFMSAGLYRSGGTVGSGGDDHLGYTYIWKLLLVPAE